MVQTTIFDAIYVYIIHLKYKQGGGRSPSQLTILTFIRIGGYDFNYLSKTFRNIINLKFI
jgi:hypothetical protein